MSAAASCCDGAVVDVDEQAQTPSSNAAINPRITAPRSGWLMAPPG
jgi:hypothetical protein